MDSTFGTHVEDEELKASAGGNGDTAEAEYVDLNDPALVSESLTDDATADAYKIPPPAPDGTWRAKLKSVPIKNPKGEAVPFFAWKHEKVNDGKPMFVTNVEVSLIDLTGKYHDTKITEQWVKTNIDRKKNTSQATTITVKAGGTPAPSPSTEKARLDALIKTLAGEPEVIVETHWEAQCMTCSERAKKSGDKAPNPFLRGQHRFPQVKDASSGHMVNDPVVACPTCKSSVRAQVRLSQFYKVGETKVTRGLA